MIKLMTIYVSATVTIYPSATERSYAFTLSTANLPMPFHEKIVSIAKLPQINPLKFVAISVIHGRTALRSACLTMPLHNTSYSHISFFLFAQKRFQFFKYEITATFSLMSQDAHSTVALTNQVNFTFRQTHAILMPRFHFCRFCANRSPP